MEFSTGKRKHKVAVAKGFQLTVTVPCFRERRRRCAAEFLITMELGIEGASDRARFSHERAPRQDIFIKERIPRIYSEVSSSWEKHAAGS
jgi:hypothetical protein